jgi:hypothetical protein
MTEQGITNLGPVPEGMTFLEATKAVAPLRKYKINPRHHSGRLTVCETQREIWRIAETLPEPERSKLQLLAGASFDYGKRMDARLKELKARCTCFG